ncbi:hypothetical protein MPH_00506 [Macrophomina phaseolina MS6]|uniref:Uncharacterized protein n=1 Tax=Macrophomina phaseolina (strain MS6) TaxID=1126212 RepID=K2S5J4_MACPH|nr:hypothetical protein MPH_00506 [Macrophomina phaseolina MS6]
MSDVALGWKHHQVELADGVAVNASKSFFPYSDATAVAATSVSIIIASLALFHLQSRSRKSTTTPFLLHLALTLDFAIEYPLILAFHPATLTYPRDPFSQAEAPSALELAAQVGVCVLVEAACALALSSRLFRIADKFASGGDDPALRSTLRFLRPRAAILLAAALLGTPSSLTAVTGRLHAASMAVWILAQQHFGTFWRTDDDDER